MFELTSLKKIEFQHLDSALSLIGLSITLGLGLGVKTFLNITQDRKVLATTQAHPIVQIFAVNLYIFTLYISKATFSVPQLL